MADLPHQRDLDNDLQRVGELYAGSNLVSAWAGKRHALESTTTASLPSRFTALTPPEPLDIGTPDVGLAIDPLGRGWRRPYGAGNLRERIRQAALRAKARSVGAGDSCHPLPTAFKHAGASTLCSMIGDHAVRLEKGPIKARASWASTSVERVPLVHCGSGCGSPLRDVAASPAATHRSSVLEAPLHVIPVKREVHEPVGLGVLMRRFQRYSTLIFSAARCASSRRAARCSAFA